MIPRTVKSRTRSGLRSRRELFPDEKRYVKVVYAVVRAGGRQEKVEVGTIVTMDRIKADKDGNVELAAVLLVDGDKITSDAKSLAKVTVTAEVG